MDLRQLRRTRGDHYLGGVAGGIAAFFDIDPIVVRVLLVVLAFFGGAGILLYAGLWLFVPEEGSDHGVLALDERSRAVVIGIVIAIAAVALIGESVDHLHLPWPFQVAAWVALVLLALREFRLVPGRFGFVPFPKVARSGHDQRAASEGIATMSPMSSPTTGTPSAATTAPVDTAAAPGGATSAAPAPPPPPGDGDAGRVTRPGRPVLPPRPRKPGPVLFWITVALILLAEGVVGTIDVAGARVVGPVYPAAALCVIALMLLLSSFWGRGGGLILLGLIATFALVAATSANEAGWHGHPQHLRVTPAYASQLKPSYSMHAGELIIDLTQVRDPRDLGGMTLDVNGRVGHIEVIVPEGVEANVHAAIHAVGAIDVFGDHYGGFHPSADENTTYLAGAPVMNIDATLGIGQIEINQEER